MKHILKIINIYFWKSIIGPLFAYLFPVIFIAILGSALGYESIFGGMLAISSMAVALTSMPQAILEFKRSSLLKRIGVTPIKPWMFLLSIGGYYTVNMILGTFFSILAAMVIFSGSWDLGRVISEPDGITGFGFRAPSFAHVLATVNWGGLLYGLLLNIFVGISLGMMIVSFCKSAMVLQGIVTPIMILSQFLSAQVLPIDMIYDIDAVWYGGYISPFRSSSILMLQSFTGNFSPSTEIIGQYHIMNTVSYNIFDVSDQWQIINRDGGELGVDILHESERILNLILPLVWTALFGGIAAKTFKWSTR